MMVFDIQKCVDDPETINDPGPKCPPDVDEWVSDLSVEVWVI